MILNINNHLLIKWFKLLVIILSVFAVNSLSANCETQTVKRIIFEGNKKTRSQILFRELEISANQVYNTNLDSLLEKSKNNLFNTALFTEVSYKKTLTENCEFEIQFFFKERWYLWPSPHFDIIDRNFNIWWQDYNHDFNRTVYGFSLDYYNATGNNDLLRLKALFGWKQNFIFEYKTPYLDKNKTIRLKPRAEYVTKRNLIYQSKDNRELFYNSDEIVWTKLKTGLEISKRVGFDISHTLAINYHKKNVADTIAILNPNYFGNGNSELKYLELFYKLTILKTDIDYYPLQGNAFEIDFLKRGFGILTDIAQTRIKANFAQYYNFKNKFSLVANIRGQYNFNKTLPFVFKDALGSGDNTIRAHELYLFNGTDFLMLRSALRYQIFALNLKNDFVKIKQLQKIPITVYAKVFQEHGKIWDQDLASTNSLTNRWLRGSGFGVDIVTFYDLVLGLEYSFNSINEKYFILQFNFKY